MRTKKTIKEMTLEMMAAALNGPVTNYDWVSAYYVAENIGRCFYRFRIEMEYNEYKEMRKTAREILNGFRKELWARPNTVCNLVSASIDNVING